MVKPSDPHSPDSLTSELEGAGFERVEAARFVAGINHARMVADLFFESLGISRVQRPAANEPAPKGKR